LSLDELDEPDGELEDEPGGLGDERGWFEDPRDGLGDERGCLGDGPGLVSWGGLERRGVWDFCAGVAGGSFVALGWLVDWDFAC
jgi:hypothetical protein